VKFLWILPQFDAELKRACRPLPFGAQRIESWVDRHTHSRISDTHARQPILHKHPQGSPSDAEVVSHKLMTRAGMIRKLAGGIYNYMPMGLRVIRKIEGHHPRRNEQGGRDRTC
jgi:hypothetical protein